MRACVRVGRKIKAVGIKTPFNKYCLFVKKLHIVTSVIQMHLFLFNFGWQLTITWQQAVMFIGPWIIVIVKE